MGKFIKTKLMRNLSYAISALDEKYEYDEDEFASFKEYCEDNDVFLLRCDQLGLNSDCFVRRPFICRDSNMLFETVEFITWSRFPRFTGIRLEGDKNVYIDGNNISTMIHSDEIFQHLFEIGFKIVPITELFENYVPKDELEEHHLRIQKIFEDKLFNKENGTQ